jgi:anti-sigma regulatory factor (Ser/Thr protein kinase)
MSWAASREFPCDHATPGQARQFCADQLTAVLPDVLATEDTIADAVLITSELTTNAVLAGCGQIELSLSVEGSGLHLAVHDDAPGIPVLRNPPPHDPHGRGLAITAHIAESWGHEPSPTGKRVWAQLPVRAT